MSGEVKRVSYGAGPSQFVLVHTPSRHSGKSLPTVVVLHGGFWKGRYGVAPPTAAIETLAPALVASGLLVAEVEYRRDGDATYGPGYTDEDAASALDLVCALPEVDKSRIVVLGHSAGGMLALSLALLRKTVPLLLMVLFAPVADLCDGAERCLSDNGDAIQRYIGAELANAPERYSAVCPACRVTELSVCDVIVYVGRNDFTVPPEYVRSFYEKMRASMRPTKFRCELVEIEDGDHYDVVNAKSVAWQSILARITDAIEKQAD